jgi:CDP-glucose 4,6-dehydratase
MLHLDWSKAAQHLDWSPALDLSQAVSLTVEWYREFLRGKNARQLCQHQIADYCAIVEHELPNVPTRKDLIPA